MDTKLHCVTDIVKDRKILGQRYKVKFAINNLGLIPVCYVGRAQMFDSKQRKRIEAELNRIAESK